MDSTLSHRMRDRRIGYPTVDGKERRAWPPVTKGIDSDAPSPAATCSTTKRPQLMWSLERSAIPCLSMETAVIFGVENSMPNED